MNNIKQVKKAARHWWIVLIQGLLFLILGVIFVMSPDETLKTLIQILAIYWLLSGALTITGATIGEYKGSRTWGFLSGSVSLLAGIFMLAYPFVAEVTTKILVYVFAFASVLYGILQIIEGTNVRKNAGKDWAWGNLLLGIFNIFFGLTLFIFPLAAAAAYVWVAGIMAIVGGLALLWTAIRLKKLASMMEELEEN